MRGKRENNLIPLFVRGKFSKEMKFFVEKSSTQNVRLSRNSEMLNLSPSKFMRDAMNSLLPFVLFD